MNPTVYRNAKVLTGNPADPDRHPEAFAVQDGRFRSVGSLAEVRQSIAEAPDPMEVDLDGAVVIPGIVDSHSHLRQFGESLGHLELSGCDSLAGIQDAVRAAIAEAPERPRIIGKGWLFSAVPDGSPTAAMLDPVSGQTPVYLFANDFHSAWLNNAALLESGIDRETPDPVGGEIARDPAGAASGMLWENAFLELCLGSLERFKTTPGNAEDLRAAFSAYAASGVTAAMDMSLAEADLEALDMLLAEQDGVLPLRVRGYWLVTPAEDHAAHAAQIRRAAELAANRKSPYFSVVGVKFIVDGVIDSCTAAMVEPFANGALPEAIWRAEYLSPAVVEADRAGLSIALHAIGDDASRIALDALESAVRSNGDIPRRHRLEHLETVTPENIERLVRLGVVASMQPVHADPAIQENWRKMLGDHRVERGYPLAEIERAGARVALSTDAPTASHRPFDNLYTAITRKSPGHPELPANLPGMVISASRALAYASYGGAYSCGEESEFGSIEAGKFADFTVLDRDPTAVPPEELLGIRVLLTVVGGMVSHRN